MKLILSQRPDPRAPPLDPAVQIVNRTSLTIGRGPDNGWVLPDPDRDLSKLHCTINYANGFYSVTDVSTNGVFLNGSSERIHRGSTVMIEDGDTLRLGAYTFAVRIEPLDSQVAAGSFPAGGNPAAMASRPPAPDFLTPVPVSNLPDPFGGVDPFGTPGSAGAAFPLPPAGDAFAQQAARMLDDFDLDDLMRPQPSERSPFGAGAPPPASGFGAPSSPGYGGDEFDMFGDSARTPDWAGPAQSDHVPSTSQFFAPPKLSPSSTPAAIPDDWDFMMDEPAPSVPEPPALFQATAFEPARTETAPPKAAMPRAATPQPAGFDPFAGPIRSPAAAPQPPAPQPAVSAPRREAVAAGDLMAAFLAGAGLDADAVGAADPTVVMTTVGQSFRQMVEGLREILMARSLVKSEFRMNQTVIMARNNNPLKFSLDADSALKALLRPPSAGYMPAEQAVAEGFKDIQAHNIAIMAGMQVALKLLLNRFKPEDLAQNLEKSSMLSNILPSARKARYWEAFVVAYSKIAREAEDDFLGVFGREFARAYEEQVGKL
jgi:type VI secretion system protein